MADFNLPKDSIQCLVCNNKIGVSTRNSVRIFDDSSYTLSEKPLVDVISAVLKTDVNKESVHSLIICKKCFKLFNEVDELESKLTKIKMELYKNYKKTTEVKKLCDILQNDEEYNDHDYTDSTGSQSAKTGEVQENENCVAKEIKQEEGKQSLVDSEDSSLTIQLVEVSETNNSEDKKKLKRSKLNLSEKTYQEDIVLRDDSSYTCLLCLESNEEGDEKEGVAAVDAKTIITHMKDVHELRLYICDICGQDFRKRTELSSHLDDHVAKEDGDYQCEICNRIFANLRLFRIHKRIHYPQAKAWTCNICEKRYSSKNLLEEHMNTHTGIRPYKCDICGKDFASKYTYKSHVKTHELRPRLFKCSQCSKTFMNQQNLNQHKRIHTVRKAHICEQCGKGFTSAHNLEVHNIVHTGYKPFICRMCGKAFARKAEIRDHERTHTGEKPYQCEFCGATFSQRSNLQSHRRATHYNDKRYKCDDCGKGFKRRRLLDYHIKAVHTGERPFKCEICEATFVYPEHFKKHTRIHTGEKPYLCEVCGKAFNSRDNRNAHRFVHSDKKPYECLVCGAGFMRKPLLYTHMQVQGHLNDTIVVNQPRLSAGNEQIIISSNNYNEEVESILTEEIESILTEEIESIDEEVESISTEVDETGLYVTELKDMIIQQEGEGQVYNEEDVVLSIPSEETVSEIDPIVEDSQISFVESEVTECTEITEFTECTEFTDCKSETNEETVYTYNQNEEGETIIVPSTSQGEDKNVRLVQIRFPTANEEGKNWLNLVQNT